MERRCSNNNNNNKQIRYVRQGALSVKQHPPSFNSSFGGNKQQGKMKETSGRATEEDLPGWTDRK